MGDLAPSLAMPAPSTGLVFPFEEDLENYLEAHLSRLLSSLGLNVLIIGRQVGTYDFRQSIDLLATDATGVIYIIELKLNRALPAVIAQVLD